MRVTYYKILTIKLLSCGFNMNQRPLYAQTLQLKLLRTWFITDIDYYYKKYHTKLHFATQEFIKSMISNVLEQFILPGESRIY